MKWSGAADGEGVTGRKVGWEGVDSVEPNWKVVQPVQRLAAPAQLEGSRVSGLLLPEVDQ